ncbi:MASE3 domain-containing sensor histidine kinase [Crassaminicella profunda]|uniref:sensor histidine kinase n=1 Tax=Crassaminicella profunda TaxID=1286698 RepID=UPI001CA6B538|nr:MASE3 domain-containing protein [Crassaminicella profunda]QZY54651.1 PAS domain-containing protein [Crassaminicella profunda]
MIDIKLNNMELHNEILQNIYKKILIFLFPVLGIIYLGFKNYIIFHSFVESFCTVIGLGITIIALNTYKLGTNNQFIFLGITYIFISIFNLLHICSFFEINIFTNTPNLTIQLAAVKWYMESISLFITVLFLNRKIKPMAVLYIYPMISSLLLVCIFYWSIFPVCYIEGLGETFFKVSSEFITIGIYILAIIFLVKQRQYLTLNVYHLIFISILLKIGSQFSLIFFKDIYELQDISYHMLSHIFKLFSFYLLYKAIIETGLKKPYELLKESEEKNRKLIDLLPESVLVCKEDHIVYANDAALKLIGCTNTKEIYNTPYSQIIRFHKDYENIISKRIKKLKTNETTVEFIEHKLILPNNNMIDTEVGGFSFKFKDEFYTISIIHDIRERKKAEELENKVVEKNKLLKEAMEYDRLKTEFFSTISHELKTPLNIILGGVQLLNKTYSDYLECSNCQSFGKHIKIMKQNCYRLLRLINNLIDITKMDSGFLKMNFKNHDIVKVIEDITLSVAEFIESKGITLIFDTDIEQKIIACDANNLERVMLNLLSNAVKFTESNGQITVNLSDKGEKIMISIKDTGIGIPENMLQKIFERFRQVDSSLHRKNEGSGIGLSLVKSIIDSHKGNITAKSKHGKGSEFIIELPSDLIDENFLIEETAVSKETNVEKIHIEFSDIYS